MLWKSCPISSLRKFCFLLPKGNKKEKQGKLILQNVIVYIKQGVDYTFKIS